MVEITKSIKATTLLESIVASTIFLLVFAAIMQTTSMLNSKKSDCYTQIVIQSAIEYTFQEFSKGDYQLGCHSKRYPWGNMDIVIDKYKDFDSLQQITISTDIDDVKYVYVIERQ